MMSERERIFHELTELFRDIFVTDDLVLTPETSAADVPGWDSMKQIEINIAVEERYGIKLTAREVDALRSVGDLVETIVRKAK